MTKPLSPLTGKSNTMLTDIFLSEDIIMLYQKQLGINVSRFFSTEKIFLYKDADNGYRFYYPQGIDGDGKFYETLQHIEGENYYHSWKFENQLAYNIIQKDDKVLDIGCGTGNFLMRVKEKTKNVFGLELNNKAVETCLGKGLSVSAELIEEHAMNNQKNYDVVCMFQVLEHIYDVNSFLKNAISVLKNGGKLIIGVPNSDPYFLGYDKYSTLNLPPHHMGLWNKKVFKKMEVLFNLQMVKVEYDTVTISASAYVHAKYLAGVKSLPAHHSTKEKALIGFWAIITLPLTILKKILGRLHGAHIAVVFKKI